LLTTVSRRIIMQKARDHPGIAPIGLSPLVGMWFQSDPVLRPLLPPSEDSASPAAARCGLTRLVLPLLKSRAPRSLLCGRPAGTLGSPLPPRPRIFTRATAVLLRPPSTPSSDRVSSSRELSAFSRVLRRARRPSCLVEPRDPTDQPKSASHGVLVPHRGIHERRPPLRGESRPRGHVPSSTFLTSSTACSATCVCGLVSSRCHVQGLPFRGLSLATEPYRVSPADSCPLAVERSRL